MKPLEEGLSVTSVSALRMSENGRTRHHDDSSTLVTEPGQGHTILIVDDDPINVSILQDLLHSVGYETLVGGTNPFCHEKWLGVPDFGCVCFLTCPKVEEKQVVLSTNRQTSPD